MLVERRAQLAPCLCQVLLESICFKGERIPLFLEYTEERGDGGEGRRARPDHALGLDIDQIVGGHLFAVDRIFAILGNVCLNEALLEDTACSDVRWVLCAKGGWGDIPLLEETTGT
jgi:hypothetical protein